jgi:hypothetical protein
MPESVAPEFARFVAAERRAKRISAAPIGLASGQVFHAVFVESGQITALLRVAARRAAGLYRPSTRTEIVWVAGDRELAVGIGDIDVKLADGLIRVLIPVRCDQTDKARIEVTFAVGAPDRPAGLFATTYRRPLGPELIVGAWSEALVAFAWQCLLGLVADLAGAIGKDERGNVLVPVELAASARGIEIVPMARHRFAGASGLRPTTKQRGGQ